MKNLKNIKGLKKKNGHEKNLGKNTGHMKNQKSIKGLTKLQPYKKSKQNKGPGKN